MPVKINRALVTEALRESNAIEDVWDELSLADALAAWDFVMRHDTLTPGIVRRTHGILMVNQPLEPEWKGAFRTCRVFVGGQEGLAWQKIPHALRGWCVWTNVENRDAQKLHVDYERIHPFADGNGRTGRIFMNWTRVKRCNLPPLVIYERKKWDYYEWFR